MTTMTTILLPLVDKTPAPSDVKPGWLAFWVVMAMLAAVVFLGFSMRKHLKRVNFEVKDAEEKPKPEQRDHRSGPSENGRPSHA